MEFSGRTPYWQAIRDFAKERGLGLADVYTRFEKEQSEKLTRSPSDMHPSADGVRLTAEEILPALKTVLSKPAPATAGRE